MSQVKMYSKNNTQYSKHNFPAQESYEEWIVSIVDITHT